MVALSTIVIFFFILVVVYPAVVGILVFTGWIKKRRVNPNDAGTRAAQIDEATDRLKNRLFIISLILAFFVIAPFLALLMVL
jgi:hypothetical protein